MNISVANVLVNDQEKAARFYTEILGFKLKHQIPFGKKFWLTVVSENDPDGIELVLGPVGFEPARVYQEALYNADIPATIFTVANVEAEYERLRKLGVKFTTEPWQNEATVMAVFDDTCGNKIQMMQYL